MGARTLGGAEYSGWDDRDRDECAWVAATGATQLIDFIAPRPTLQDRAINPAAFAPRAAQFVGELAIGTNFYPMPRHAGSMLN